MESSLWAATQSETLSSTLGHVARACTALSLVCFSISSPALITEGLWFSAHQAAPILTQLRTDLTISTSGLAVTLLTTSAMVLSHPFWYSI